MNVGGPRDTGRVWVHTFMDPTVLHDLARQRQGELCARCWEPLPADLQELHHRQRRRVLGWCPCNVVGLHPRCHTQGPLAVHDHPTEAQALGLIVPTWEAPPEVAVTVRWPWEGQAFLSCAGLLVSELVESVDRARL